MGLVLRLIGLKNIFARQLPNMPKEYIVRLVMDRYFYVNIICASLWRECALHVMDISSLIYPNYLGCGLYSFCYNVIFSLTIWLINIAEVTNL